MKFRLARHTNDLDKIKCFYINVLGFEFLGSFVNHNHYDGIFIGKSTLDWHFEFTKSDELSNHHFDEDDILVLYPETLFEYNTIINTILKFNISKVISKNPYWNENGIMLLDPDGYRIVISNLKAK